MLEEIQLLIADFKDIDLSDVSPECNLLRDIGFTSFQILALVSEIEEKYDLEIPAQVLRQFVTPRCIYEYIISQVG